MAKSRKQLRIAAFCIVGLGIVGIAAFMALRKREPVIIVQTENVTRRNLTELVRANGKIQPVVQVKISPEVSGEIIDLPVKEGQQVHKGDLIFKIKPDVYIANRNQAEANYKSSLAAKATAEANLKKASAENRRNEGLVKDKLVSESASDEVTAAYEVAQAQLQSAGHQVEMAKASMASSEEELAKTTVFAPITGTISKLNSRLGERVLGMVQNMGTEVMTISDLNEMEARVDIGEVDVVSILPGQHVRLTVDAFKDRKFTGVVTDIANSSNDSKLSSLSSSTSQEATKFEIQIRIAEKEAFRPGMSVTAEIETRYRTNALAVSYATVTARLPKASTNNTQIKLPPPAKTNALASTNSEAKITKETPKQIEVVFVTDGDHAKMIPVKIGINDDDYWEIVEGLSDGQEVICGGPRAISRDLEDGKKIRKGPAGWEPGKTEEK